MLKSDLGLSRPNRSCILGPAWAAQQKKLCGASFVLLSSFPPMLSCSPGPGFVLWSPLSLFWYRSLHCLQAATGLQLVYRLSSAPAETSHFRIPGSSCSLLFWSWFCSLISSFVVFPSCIVWYRSLRVYRLSAPPQLKQVTLEYLGQAALCSSGPGFVLWSPLLLFSLL